MLTPLRPSLPEFRQILRAVVIRLQNLIGLLGKGQHVDHSPDDLFQDGRFVVQVVELALLAAHAPSFFHSLIARKLTSVTRIVSPPASKSTSSAAVATISTRIPGLTGGG